MTTPSEHPSPAGGKIPDSLRQRIEASLALKDNIVLALTQAAESIGGNRRRQLMRISDRVAFVKNADALLRDAILLELFLPLVVAQPELLQSEARVRQGEVERKVFQSLQRQVRQSQAKTERWNVLLYPMLVSLLSAILFAGMSIVIMPIFEQMFNEFGLMLPAPTAFVIAIAGVFRSVWFWLLFGLLFIFFVGMVGIQVANKMRSMVLGNVEPWLSGGYSSRRSMGDFAWHTALLIEIGLTPQVAVELAGTASRRAKMRQDAPRLAQHFGLNEVTRDPLVEQPDPLGQSVANWYLGIPCHLLVHALKLPSNSMQQSSLLREVADIYFDREQTSLIWILSWIPPFYVVFIGLVVGFLLLALFLPMIELISGLS